MKRPKVLLIGWDAADWQIIGPLLAKGEMPALKSLIDKGVYGNMATMNPPYSPMLWTTVATGKTPDKHGILGFIELMPDLQGVRPVTVHSRKSRALWNILHHEGFKSNIVGWWPSFPSEPINGHIVSDKFQKIKGSPKESSNFEKGTTYPENLIEQIKDLKLFPNEITEAHILPFMPNAAKINQEKDRSLISFAKVISENVSVHAAATHLLRHTDWDFMTIYYDLIDHLCHAFMKYHPPKLAAVPHELFDIYKDTVKGAYKFQDMMLSRALDLIGPDTNIIVVSDHGYESGQNRIIKMPKYPAAPSLEHRQFGIFVAAGPNIKRNEKVFGLGLVDVAPTILQMFNLPIGKDMDGKVALDIFKESKHPEYIDSWDNLKGDFGEHHSKLTGAELGDQDTMDQLIELGYIEKPDEKIEDAILKTKCDLKYNLARVYIGKNELDKAKEILLELMEEELVDTIPYLMDLLNISLKEKSFDLAEKYLNELKIREKKFRIRTYLAESKILLSKGLISEALEVLEEAKNNKPNSEIWYQIGKIYMNLSDYRSAQKAFENSLEMESDRAKVHNALANCFLQTNNYEDALDHALTSIELVKYYPEAHYTLGNALEKLGDIENAKMAFETATKLKPKKHFRAEHALQNLGNNNQPQKGFKYWDDQIVIVSGLPRSGTSLMMQMLHLGGMEVLTDNNRKSDVSNPKGYYEFDPVMSIHKDNSWLNLAQNKVIKVVAPLLKHLDPEYRYKVIFMNRDLTEIIQSQQKMRGKDIETLPLSLFKAFERQLDHVELWKENEPGIELLNINYTDVLENPEQEIASIQNFIGIKLDVANMVGCVDKSLYRNRSKGVNSKD